MQGRPGQVRNGRLQVIEAVVERQQGMLAEGDDDSLFLGRQHCRARSFRPHGTIVDEGPFAPLGDCLVVQPILCRKLFERSLRSLYRSSDGVFGRGSATKYLAHSASRNAGSVCLIPSHSGIEHLARRKSWKYLAGRPRVKVSHKLPAVGGCSNSGGGIRRREAASYAEAILRRMSSFPGSARNTKENGSPGGGS